MKIISGGQTGADQAGLSIAKDLGFETGGWAPKGWLTSKGSQQKLLESFNLKESDEGYKGRTWQNVRDSNATIRLAVNFESPGEACTLNAINYFKKPWIDIDLLNNKPCQELLEFLILVKPSILNIAGNTQHTQGYDIENMVTMYLREVLIEYKRIYLKG
ncbi:MAG: hypothetical protein DRI84_02870 [Bacteroidetes bacterium]|nr:MAG: hypothetical protein DRI84_02870 [Bacteroidota bacterium]